MERTEGWDPSFPSEDTPQREHPWGGDGWMLGELGLVGGPWLQVPPSH